MLIANQLQNIKEILRAKRGMLPVVEKQSLLGKLECTEDQLMLALLPIAREFAVVPVSQFKVGAVALGETGNLYLGANQELGHAALNEAIHAEQAAVAVAHCHGETNIIKIAVNANPCGHCRQFLYECVDGSAMQILVEGHSLQSLSALLPRAFGPNDLHVQGGLFMPALHQLTLTEASSDAMTLAALQAAKRSYSPYTQSYAGVALQTHDNLIFAGSYLENAAYNPSLSPLQAALALLIQSGYHYQDVASAVLLQMKNPNINLRPSTQYIFSMLCEKVRGNLRFDELEFPN